MTTPTGAPGGALSYTATPAAVCTVDAATGALTLVGIGGCTITATAASSADYNEAAASFALTIAPAGTPDRTAPALQTATVDRAALVLTYDEALDTGSVPPASAFTVTVAGSARGLSASSPVAVSGNAVTLTLSSAAGHGESVTVSYAVPSGDPVQDVAGNDAAALSDRTVTNETPDEAVPVLRSAVVNGAALVLTYDEALDTGSVPPASAFTVRVAGAVRGLAGGSPVAVNGATVTLTLSSAAGHGETVTVSYAVPSGDPVQDVAGNDAAALSDRTVTNETPDEAVPVLRSAVVNGAALVLTYDEALDTGSVPPASAFTVRVAGAVRGLAGGNPVAVSGTNVTLTLASAVDHGETVTLSYAAPPANPIQDGSGNKAAALTDATVTNGTPGVVVRPAILSVSEGGSARYTVALATQPSADVTVTPSVAPGGDTDLALASSSALTFTRSNWSTAQTVRVNAAEDDDTAAGTATVEHRVASADAGYNGLDAPSVTATEADNDERGVTVTPTSLTVLEGEAGQTYTVTLNSEPTGPVTVTATLVGDAGSRNVTIDPSSLTFTALNWNDPRIVTVSAANDDTARADATVEVAHAVSGGDYDSTLAGSVSVSLPGLSIETRTVIIGVPDTGTVEVPPGTPVPTGTRVTVPPVSGTVEISWVVSMAELDSLPPGFRTGDTVVDIHLGDSAPLSGMATVCLPLTDGGSGMVLRYDEDAGEWVRLPEPEGGSPPGLACGLTEHFSLFAAVSAPREGVAVAEAWLSRFGRTVAEQVTEAVEGRFSASHAPGLEMRLAGQAVGGPGAAKDDEVLRLEAVTKWLKGMEDDGERPDRRTRMATGRDLLTGSSFALTGETREGGTVSLWGRGAVSQFEGSESETSLDGEVASAMLGADWTRKTWTAGLLVMRSVGDGDYRGPEIRGALKSRLTGVFPYGRVSLNDRMTLWGIAGYGAGELTLAQEDRSRMRTDMELAMGAVGLRGVAVEAPAAGGFELAVKSDAMGVRTASEKTEGLDAEEPDTTRLRLGLEGTWQGLRVGGGRFAPRLEAGLRHDGGDAETGFGLDLGGGFSWSDAGSGFTAEVSGRQLLTHESRSFRNRSFSGSLNWDPSLGTELGPKVSLSHTVGEPAPNGVEALRRAETALGPIAANDGGDRKRRRRLDLNLGYGLEMLDGRYTSVPELGFRLSETGRETVVGWRAEEARRTGLVFGLGVKGTRTESSASGNGPEHRLDLGLGWRLRPGQGEPSALELNLEATQHEAANDNETAERSIRLGLTARW